MSEIISRSTVTKVIENINSPLGFFVLCLFIIESFLASALIWSDLAPGHKFVCVWMAVVMFLVVVVLVFLLVWNRPTNLTFDKEAHLVDRRMVLYGSNEKQGVDVASLPKPNLTFDKEAHLVDRGMVLNGSSEKPGIDGASLPTTNVQHKEA